MKIISVNPSNYQVIGEVQGTSKQELESVVQRAHTAQTAWAALPLAERCQAVASLVTVMKDKAEDLAHVITQETGRPISGSRLDVAKGIGCFEEYLATAELFLAPTVTLETDTELHRVYREPWGVIAAICPWNFPTTNIAWQCGQALIAGNAVVYKNSEENPLFAQLLAEIIGLSQLPSGVFSVVYGNGEVGEWLARSNVDKISFTGSFVTGHKLTLIAAEQFIPITTELGGSNPYIIFEGVMVSDEIIQNIWSRRFLHSGQFCTSVKRLIVHESVFDDVVRRLVNVTKTKQIGDPLNEATDFGPLVARRQLERLEAQVADAIANGAKVEVGGKRPTGLRGAYYEPTIVTQITPTMQVWREETFGPVLPVVSFATEEEAISLANDSEYGLSAYMAAKDKAQFARVARQLQAGMIADKHVINLVAGTNPFGGYKHSGMGRENGEIGFHEATQVKLVSEEK